MRSPKGKQQGDETMGVIEDMLSALSGGKEAMHADLPQAMHGLIGDAGSPGIGLAGLLQRLEQAGLGPIVQSWLGRGPNQRISPEQLHGALGDGAVQSMATRAGLSPTELISQLSEHLPGVIDRLSPTGQLPPHPAPAL
jgi:uncharacterized protein YidB (DUF937 family)